MTHALAHQRPQGLIAAHVNWQFVFPEKLPDIELRDPDDKWVLASAVVGAADVLVTGDKDLLSSMDAAPLPILTPRAFWESLPQRR